MTTMVVMFLVLCVVCLLAGLYQQGRADARVREHERHYQAILRQMQEDSQHAVTGVTEFLANLLATKERDTAMQFGDLLNRASTPFAGRVRVRDEEWDRYEHGDPDEVEAEQERAQRHGADDGGGARDTGLDAEIQRRADGIEPQGDEPGGTPGGRAGGWPVFRGGQGASCQG